MVFKGPLQGAAFRKKAQQFRTNSHHFFLTFRSKKNFCMTNHTGHIPISIIRTFFCMISICRNANHTIGITYPRHQPLPPTTLPFCSCKCAGETNYVQLSLERDAGHPSNSWRQRVLELGNKASNVVYFILGLNKAFPSTPMFFVRTAEIKIFHDFSLQDFFLQGFLTTTE